MEVLQKNALTHLQGDYWLSTIAPLTVFARLAVAPEPKLCLLRLWRETQFQELGTSAARAWGKSARIATDGTLEKLELFRIGHGIQAGAVNGDAFQYYYMRGSVQSPARLFRNQATIQHCGGIK
eukprot:scaffold2325_cov126-Cylindrotheca_fusiformis.AAC.9